MSDQDPAYHLDVPGLEQTDQGLRDSQKQPWLGVLFECCGVYARVYRSRDGAFYRGRCPRCLREVRFRVGRTGTSARFFRAC